MSFKMVERQAKRKSNGRYADMYRCEFCDKALGEGYHSLSDCNTTGVGLICCKKCCDEKESAK